MSALFADIQRELDETWATFGEVYGRFVPLNGLGLTIRRIRSTLDDVEKLSRRLPFLPLKASFKSSDTELLELLIGPLYSYDPSVGVRELIQNAVDACRELDDLNVDIDLAEQRPQEADVEVHLTDENKKKVLRISDKGTGMTSDVVLNYFLVAGASFRNSDVWKEQHTDSKGQSKVLRGGRFGVGALAAFLLGKRITVETRHYSVSSDGGIRFQCSVGDQIIELQKANLPIGTSISIEIDALTWNKLAPLAQNIETSPTRDYDKCSSWGAVNWYGLESPSVAVIYNGPRYNYKRDVIEGAGNLKTVIFEGFRVFSEFQTWKELPDPGNYDRILWSPKHASIDDGSSEGDSQAKKVKHAPRLTVNGIRVGAQDSAFVHENLNVETDSGNGLRIAYQRPPLAIFDPSGICPLNLQRDSVNFTDLGIDDRLATELIDNFLQIVEPHISGPKSVFEFLKHIRHIENSSYLKFIEYPHMYAGQSLVCPFVLTTSGMLLLDAQILQASGISSLLLLPVHKVSKTATFPLTHLNAGEGLILTRFGDGVAGTLSWFRAMAGHNHYADWFRPRALSGLRTLKTLGIASSSTKKLVTQPGKVRRDMLSGIEWFKDAEGDGEFFKWAEETNLPNDQVERISEFSKACEYAGDISHWKLHSDNNLNVSALGKRWHEMFG